MMGEMPAINRANQSGSPLGLRSRLQDRRRFFDMLAGDTAQVYQLAAFETTLRQHAITMS